MDTSPDRPLVNGHSASRAFGKPHVNGLDSSQPVSGPSLISTPHHSSSTSKVAGSSTPVASTGPTPPKHSSPSGPHVDPQHRPISPPPTNTSPSYSRPDSNEVDTSAATARPSALPGPKAVKGSITTHDPWLDPKPGDTKKTQQPPEKLFTHEVWTVDCRALRHR